MESQTFSLKIKNVCLTNRKEYNKMLVTDAMTGLETYQQYRERDS